MNTAFKRIKAGLEDAIAFVDGDATRGCAHIRGDDMPKGPKGEKRPADAIGLAVMVGRIATGEIEDTPEDDGKDKAAQELGRKGGKARAEGMTPERRAEIARKAAEGRWNKT